MPGDFGDDVAFDAPAADHRGPRPGARHRRQPRVLPVDPAEVLPRRDRPAQGARPRRRPAADSWRRVVVEKPFGHDLQSAQELNATIHEVFPPESVFRIDHYLGKETVQNILAMRFANAMFEPIWNANYVDHVQITMAEDIGIGGRAGYYDGIGAARDVIQNHLLQLMALIAMEEPTSFDAQSLRLEKQKVLSLRRTPPAARPAHRPRRSTPRAGPAARRCSATSRSRTSRTSSTTETFAAIKLEHRDPPLGRGAVLPAAPASGSAGGSPRWPWSSSGPRTCRSPRPPPRSSPRTRW